MDIAKFVDQVPLLTEEDWRMINRADFQKQVDLARNYLSQFHVNNVNDGKWFSARGRKPQAEKYYRNV